MADWSEFSLKDWLALKLKSNPLIFLEISKPALRSSDPSTLIAYSVSLCDLKLTDKFIISVNVIGFPWFTAVTPLPTLPPISNYTVSTKQSALACWVEKSIIRNRTIPLKIKNDFI